LFHIATARCSLQLVDLIHGTVLYRIDDDRTKRGMTPLHTAAQLNWAAGVQYMLAPRDAARQVAAHAGALRGTLRRR
jgi:hypothetical protein